MKILLSEADLRLIERLKKVVGNIKVDPDGYIELDELLGILWDMEDEYGNVEKVAQDMTEKLDTLKENSKPCDCNDNWRYYQGTIDKLQDIVRSQNEFIKERGLEDDYKKYRGN